MHLHHCGELARDAALNGIALSQHKPGALTRRASLSRDLRTHGERKGLVLSRQSLFQNQLIKRQIRHRLAKPLVLFLDFFETFGLTDEEALEVSGVLITA